MEIEASTSERRWKRPMLESTTSSKDWTPSDTLLKPSSSSLSIPLLSNVPGSHSTVISASSATPNDSLIVWRISHRVVGGRREGVPPPK
eukprot:CAMPEP_0118660634 /NCGR_PEP_ID=MMETSP0785-20121206/15802_1 /TAXON_ID=91992 /ORGANISM="Bolidomonas pacifica, Strain CCMP 1866" /LENGTH=88 /DNA_ID=CAMNT_0006553923 /DNA_START=435 /DNA_END=701 /DNA_ORIENTATION=-